MLSRKSVLEAIREKYVQSEMDEFTKNSSLPCLQGRVGVG